MFSAAQAREQDFSQNRVTLKGFRVSAKPVQCMRTATDMAAAVVWLNRASCRS